MLKLVRGVVGVAGRGALMVSCSPIAHDAQPSLGDWRVSVVSFEPDVTVERPPLLSVVMYAVELGLLKCCYSVFEGTFFALHPTDGSKATVRGRRPPGWFAHVLFAAADRETENGDWSGIWMTDAKLAAIERAWGGRMPYLDTSVGPSGIGSVPKPDWNWGSWDEAA